MKPNLRGQIKKVQITSKAGQPIKWRINSMAEKEERILVLKATEDDFIYKHFNGNGFIPRQEAIRKMCDSYFKAKDKGLMESERVEAALNALLELGK